MISLILLILAGVAKAVMDAVAHGKFVHKGSAWLDPLQSWKNKWKNGDPKQGEAFPGSSTVFVFVTDGWHFFQFLFLNLLFASAIPYAGLKTVVILRVVFGVVFEVSYRLLERKK